MATWLRRRAIGGVAKKEGQIGSLWLRKMVRSVAWCSKSMAEGGRLVVAKEESDRRREDDSKREEWEATDGERERERSLINNYSIFAHTISLIGLHSSKCQNYLAFDTSHEACFLGFGVSNAKYLALSTFDTNALKGSFCCKW